jgi:hypothetical protein
MWRSRLLLMAAVCLLLGAPGCIVVPGFELGPGIYKDFRPLIGPVDSKAPIRPGATTSSRVLELLGSPFHIDGDGSVIAFRFATVKWYMLSPLMHFNQSFYRDHYLFLRFAPGGTLLSYKIVVEPFFDNEACDFYDELHRFITATKPPNTSPSG